MALGSALGSALLLLRNLNVNKSTTHVIKKDKSEKPFVFSSDNIKRLERGTPEEFGYSSEYVQSFLNELSNDLSIRANRILVVKGNKVIAEKYASPYVPDAWDCVFSATKTVTALALGVLYDEGKVDLNVPVCDILEIKRVGNLANKKITLKHLLTMTTGNTFNELESAASLKWLKGYFDSPNKFPIGSKFEYNSLNTYVIGACVEKISGMPLSEFVREKIFDPLGVNETFFERSPEGIAKSGWGLYILPEDMAKLGILMRDYGVFDGKRILSEKWIKKMSTKRFSATKAGHRFDYGYQMWADDEKNFCCFNGMYNQDILIYRNSGFIVVLCCANNEAFHGSNLYAVAEKYFVDEKPGSFPLVQTGSSHEIADIPSLHSYYDSIKNKLYLPVEKKANSCGVLPLIIQNEMGTYVKGIKSFLFGEENDESTLTLVEGDEEKIIRFNFGSGVRQRFSFYENEYDCVADGRFILNGKGEPFLVVRIFFLEFASSRYITLRFGKDKNVLSVEFSENPGLEFIQALLETQDKATKALIGGVMKIVDADLIATKARNIFSPTFTLKHEEKAAE